jgi:hypothetical protein
MRLVLAGAFGTIDHCGVECDLCWLYAEAKLFDGGYHAVGEAYLFFGSVI